MILRRVEMFKCAVISQPGPLLSRRHVPPHAGSVYMEAARSQGPKDLLVSAVGMKEMLKDVPRDNDVEDSVRKSLILKVFTPAVLVD